MMNDEMKDRRNIFMVDDKNILMIYERDER